MNRHFKSSLYKVFSAIPGGNRLYQFVQTHITKSIVPNAQRIAGKLAIGMDYWEWLSSTSHEEALIKGRHIDFGAGWHPTIPLLFYSLGSDDQRLLDVSPVMRARAVADTIRIFQQVAPTIAQDRGVTLPRLPFVSEGCAKSVATLLRPMGIQYLAPYDESSLVGAGLITSTQVLLHLEEDALQYWFSRIANCLLPDGLFMATIHLKPLYSGLLESQHDLSHLRYSSEEWQRFGSRLISYNRLKAPDYRRLLIEAGLKPIAFDVTPGAPEDIASLKGIPIHPCFANYAPEDLVAKHLFFVVQKSNG